jgi:hypothetical protein
MAGFGFRTKTDTATEVPCVQIEFDAANVVSALGEAGDPGFSGVRGVRVQGELNGV